MDLRRGEGSEGSREGVRGLHTGWEEEREGKKARESEGEEERQRNQSSVPPL